MKSFFSRNRRTVETLLTLLLVFIAGGYYYLIYIPERENEIIERRFRTLQKIDDNMQEKFQGYMATIKNYLGRADESFFKELAKGYNTDPDRFTMTVKDEDITRGETSRKKLYDSLSRTFNVDSTCESRKVILATNGRKIVVNNEWYKWRGKRQDTIKHISLEATINYKEFVIPLLRKNVFDHYIVFNVVKDTSNVVYEDFHSGISFNKLDSLFDTNQKIYTSKIIRIETGGEKYLAFLHPCGYNNKNDRIVVGLLRQERFDKEKRQLPENMVTTILFIALFSFLLLPFIRLTLMGKKERVRLLELFTGYFSFLLLIPVIILLFFWNNKYFLPQHESRDNSKKVLADQISKNLSHEFDSAYTFLDKIDLLHSLDTNLTMIDTINVRYLNHKKSDRALAHYFDTKENPKHNLPFDKAVRYLDSLVTTDLKKYRNEGRVFWMNSTSGREIANWAFDEDPPRGNYKDRDYFKNARDNNVVSLNNDPGENIAIGPVISRTDGSFRVVIAKKSKDTGFIVAYSSRFPSVMNPVLPMGYDFSITDAAGNTIFDSDTTDNLNENLLDEFEDQAFFKIALDTKTAQKFTTRYEDEECSVLAQPVPGLPYFIVICENGSFNSSLKTQSFSFTIIMMFSFFLFLCVEILIVFICHYRQTKLLKNNFDLSWIHPHESMSYKYFFLFLFNICLLIVLALFSFGRFSIDKLPEYIFLFVIASLLSSIAACVFKAHNSTSASVEEKKKKRTKNTLIALSALAIVVQISSWHYSFKTGIMALAFSTISILLFIALNYLRKRTNEKGISDYRVNFRLMIFSKLLLTSGLPVIVFFICSYNFEKRLEERLKLLNYAENIEQHIKNKETLQSIIGQINSPNSIKSFYTDLDWINSVKPTDTIGMAELHYTYADSICLRLLKTSRLHYNDVSGSTENFELIKPFEGDSNQFAFNNIFDSCLSNLTYRITEMQGDSAIQKYIALSSSATKTFKTPSIFSIAGFIFWALLFTALTICYLLLKYTINKIFGINIPDIEDAKTIHSKLLEDEKIKYLFVQGIPGSGKTAFIKKHLENKKFTFYDKINPQNYYNAIIFNLEEIPGEDEIENERAAFEKESDPCKLKENWYFKISALFNRRIECIMFAHFEYKILDDHTNKIKLNLIEKVLHENKRKIILSSDIDPVEYFYSLKKFIYGSFGMKNKKTGDKKDVKESSNEQDSNAAFFENMSRWNNLLGRFTNIYTDNNSSVATGYSVDSLSEEFLAAECSHPAFLNKYHAQFETLSSDDEKTEDNILKIQSLSDHSYRQIWYSLTKEEQLTLYDLAEDGLINTTNYMSLTMLLNKGLVLKKDGVLILMNRSFRNFVLTNINSEEVKAIEKKICDGQTWNDYKYPVLIILGALIYFVLSSNPEKFGNVLPLVSGIMAGIPTILKLLSYLKPTEVKM